MVTASDFPIWIRVTHYVNLLFMFLLIRAGLQILMAHPRLYWNTSCKPGSEWALARQVWRLAGRLV